MAQHEVSFVCTDEERSSVQRIVDRYNSVLAQHGYKPLKALEVQMDLIATHANGCPMDFAKLEAADDFNLLHDVDGIGEHLDRSNGQLLHCFRPRCAAKEPVSA